MDALFLELHFSVTGGAYTAIGDLELYCWLRAVRLPGHVDAAKLVAVDRRGGQLGVRESDLEIGRLASFVSLLEDLGFPARRLRVEGAFDTSDFWQHVVLRVTLNDDTETVELSLCSSGFEGEDADGLRRVFRWILETADAGDRRRWRNLTGPARPRED